MYPVSPIFIYLLVGIVHHIVIFRAADARFDGINHYFRTMKRRILFVCLGNICRSPAAEGVLRDMALRSGMEERVEIDSAGTYSSHAGQLPDTRMRAAALARGYVLTHHARPIRESDFFDFDIIVAMDDNNYHNLFRLAPTIESREKIFRMSEFFTRHKEWTHVPDPYYEGHEGFELVLDMLEDGCAEILRRAAKGTL